jgi:hypothetical protein
MPSNDQFSFSSTYPEIIDINDVNEEETNTIEQVTSLVQKICKNHHGFFTPYKSVPDFIDTLIAPVGAPVVLGIASGLFLTGSVIASVATLGAICTAAGAALFDSDYLLIGSLGVLSMAALATGITALVGVALAFATVLSIPYTLIELVTRTAATIISPIVDACCSEESDESELSQVAYPTY